MLAIFIQMLYNVTVVCLWDEAVSCRSRPERVIIADQPGHDPDERTRAAPNGAEGDGLPLG